MITTILTLILVIVIPIIIMDKVQISKQTKKEEIHQKIKAGLWDPKEK